MIRSMVCSFPRIVSLLAVFLSIHLVLNAQNRQNEGYSVVFYNTENLFDTFDNPSTNDNEYTPAGKNHWTREKLSKKFMMVYCALISAANGTFPDIIGLAEIENLDILERLLQETPLGRGNYGIIHKESPDPRGIDVALLYRKERVAAAGYGFIPVPRKKTGQFSSRDILFFRAKLQHDYVVFWVNHWPSRSGGYLETRGKRDVAASILRLALDSVGKAHPDSRMLMMGDFNAVPEEECFTRILGATTDPAGEPSKNIVNLSGEWMKQRLGTIRTKAKWEIFDQFLCTRNLLHTNGIHLSIPATKICTEDFLLEPDQRYLGKKPFRTYLGPVYHGGVSDHLPVSTRLLADEGIF